MRVSRAPVRAPGLGLSSAEDTEGMSKSGGVVDGEEFCPISPTMMLTSSGEYIDRRVHSLLDSQARPDRVRSF